MTWNSGDSWWPSIAIDSNNHIHLAWNDNSLGNDEIYYKKSTDGGATWATKRLTYSSESSYVPFIVLDSNNHLHVAWMDFTPGNGEIFYKRSTDGGANWTTKRLTSNSGDSYAPAIAIESGNHIHVVWHDRSPGNYEIYHRKGIQ